MAAPAGAESEGRGPGIKFWIGQPHRVLGSGPALQPALQPGRSPFLVLSPWFRDDSSGRVATHYSVMTVNAPGSEGGRWFAPIALNRTAGPGICSPASS